MGIIVDANQHGRIVLEFMAKRGMKVTDNVPIDAILDYGIDKGLGLDEMESALIQASIAEWILLVGPNAHLTKAGYALLSPANDNSREQN